MATAPEHGGHRFVVRTARRGDAGAFMEMWGEVVAEGRLVRPDTVHRSEGHYRRRYFRRSWTPDQVSLVAVAGDRLVGHLTASREEGAITRHVATLGMAVRQEWRGRGVGSALMTETMRWARWAGVEKLALSVFPGNEAALALYRKFGFSEEGRLTGHSKKAAGYMDEIIMGLWLVDRP